MADPKRDGYEPPVDSQKPTTVREWLPLLSKLGKFTQLANSTNQCAECHSWRDLFHHLSCYSPDGVTAKRHWLGAFYYVADVVFNPSDVYVAVVHGYNAAKAAFEAQEPMPKNVVGNSDQCPIGYIAVAPDDLAELNRKANAYDTLLAKVDAFEGALDDFRRARP
jgi:hypothetical protein